MTQLPKVRVKAVRKIDDQPYVCDVTVQDNHNLFTRDKIGQRPILAHNSKGEFFALERICLEFGMSHYEDSPIAKSERDRIETFDLDKVAKYGAIDVVLPLRLMRMQIALARWRNEHMYGRPYRDFVKAITEVESAKLLQFWAMERNGLNVDREYMVSLQGPGSPLLKEIREEEAKFLQLPEVQQANQRLRGTRNVRARSLFGNSQTISGFDPGKIAHQQMLFFDVMKLEPITRRKDGGGSVDDFFKKKYKDHAVVKHFTILEEAKKLLSTFVVGPYKLLVKMADNKDGCLHTRFGYLFVVTGRSSSGEPNLQNLPARNKARAKMVKRQFIARRGYLILKCDMSAHEVRLWGLTAGDKAVCESFWQGMKVRLRFEMQVRIPAETKAKWDSLLKAADVHRQNFARLNNVAAASVTEEQRGGVKGTIFGVLYGMSLMRLGKQLQQNRVSALKKELESSKFKERLEKELREAQTTDWEPEASRIHSLIFKKTFSVGGKWLQRVQEVAREHLVVRNILGGVRHLFGHLHVERSIYSAMDRRTPNSLIQGPASNIGLRGGYELRKLMWELFESKGIDLGYHQMNSVHDSLEQMVSIVNIPLVEYLRIHAFTDRLHVWMRDTFGVNLLVGFEQDSELGATLAEMKKTPRYDDQVATVRAGLEWGNANLGWKLDTDAYMKIVEHNAKVIFKIRRREIARQLKNGERTTMYMEMTRDNCMKYGLVFEPPKEKAQADAAERLSKRVLERELEEE